MKIFTPLFQAIIAFVAILTGLGFVFNLQLGPVKKDIAILEAKIDQVLYELRNHSHKHDRQDNKNHSDKPDKQVNTSE